MLQRKSLNFIYGILGVGPKLIPLCLFLEKVSTEAKQKICEAMLQCGEDWSNRRIKLQDSKKLENKELYFTGSCLIHQRTSLSWRG